MDRSWWRVLIKCGPLEEKKKGKPRQHFCLENPMNSMKRQKDMTLKDEFSRSLVPNMLLENSGEIVQEGMKRLSQSGNNFQLWMFLVAKVKFNAIQNNFE